MLAVIKDVRNINNGTSNGSSSCGFGGNSRGNGMAVVVAVLIVSVVGMVITTIINGTVKGMAVIKDTNNIDNGIKTGSSCRITGGTGSRSCWRCHCYIPPLPYHITITCTSYCQN